MLMFTLRRLSLFFFTMLMLTILAFSLSFLFPGDPLINLTGEVNASPVRLQQLVEQYHTNHSIFNQYINYVANIFSGNFGISMSSQLSISNEIASLLPATIELSLMALVIAMLWGIPLGFIAAIFHRKKIDNAILTFAIIGYSIPVFWLGLFVILVFSIQLSWFPSAGNISLLFEIEQTTGFLFVDILLSENPYKWQALANALSHIILPASVIALAPATVFIRLARTAMMEVLATNYIQAAKTKGLTFIKIIYRHAIRNALIKMIRHIGLQFANLITFVMITEVIFSWPGIGRWLILSIYQRDYTAIQSGLLVLSAFVFVVHIVTDFIYAALNPLARDHKHGS
ncbi:MAG: peptide ABC transporter permease [Gammaproteobacteria bacterium]|nr:MAG: peptide ABC transporter permease [Gammaproteobacteria bacterium]